MSALAAVRPGAAPAIARTRILGMAAAVAAGGLAVAVIGGAAPAQLARAMAVVAIGAAALVDARSRRIPNALVAVALTLGLAAAADRSGALAAGVAAAAPLILAAFAWPGAMGMGDVKLALAAGAVAGPSHLGNLLVGTAVIGAGFAVVVAVARGPRATFAYGPAIAAALLLALR